MGNSKSVLFAGNRLFMKFAGLDYFSSRLNEAGFSVISGEGMDSRELETAAADASAVVVIAQPVTRRLLESMPKCEFVMTLSVGYDCVDVAAATSLGIPVSNSPTYCSEDVANHALTLLVTVARKLHLTTPAVKAGGWTYAYTKPIFRFRGRTLGIVGLGKIGRALVPKARGLGFDVVAYDPYLADDVFAAWGVDRCYEFDELVERSDAISIHAPLTGETRHLFDASVFESMARDSVLVNTARGSIIDQDALVAALESGQIAGAGIDVLEREPPAADEPILSCERALVTPHIAWYSEESFEQNKSLGMDELIRVLSGGRPRYVVNPAVFGAAT